MSQARELVLGVTVHNYNKVSIFVKCLYIAYISPNKKEIPALDRTGIYVKN